jgi:MFS family permease
MHGGIRTATEADSRGGRVVGGSVIAVLFMGSTLLTPLYDLYATTYGLSVVGIGLLYAVYVVGNLVALLFLGKVSDQPREARRAFVAPAAAGFAAMSLVGFYAALGPSMIRESLHVSNHAWSAAIVAELFVVAAIVIFATRNAPARATLQLGLFSMPLGVALLVAAQRTNSMALMLASSAVCGLSGALGYRSGLAVANGLAPAARRAEVASTYFVCCFLGNALPIIGVTALAQFIGLDAASLVFAVIVSLLGFAALAAMRARKPATPVGN